MNKKNIGELWLSAEDWERLYAWARVVEVCQALNLYAKYTWRTAANTILIMRTLLFQAEIMFLQKLTKAQGFF